MDFCERVASYRQLKCFLVLRAKLCVYYCNIFLKLKSVSIDNLVEYHSLPRLRTFRVSLMVSPLVGNAIAIELSADMFVQIARIFRFVLCAIHRCALAVSPCEQVVRPVHFPLPSFGERASAFTRHMFGRGKTAKIESRTVNVPYRCTRL